jgi:hypothetical protein
LNKSNADDNNNESGDDNNNNNNNNNKQTPWPLVRKGTVPTERPNNNNNNNSMLSFIYMPNSG